MNKAETSFRTPKDANMTDWPHSPPHKTLEKGTYMLTGGTLHKQLLFNTPEKLDLLLDVIFEAIESFKAKIEAWAVMSNHYHLILFSNEENILPALVSKIHGSSAVKLNKIDESQGRRVWHNYYDSCITYQESYFSRLNYVNKNPEFHGVIDKAENYRWCSEAWYNMRLDKAFTKTVKSFKFDKIKIKDDF